MTETARLTKEANVLIEQSDLEREAKENLKRNVALFLSLLSDEKYVADCKWQWFDYGEEGRGLDLIWQRTDVEGTFGFYEDNGHSFCFAFGEKGKTTLCGGEDGEYGFSCGLFVHDFKQTLSQMG